MSLRHESAKLHSGSDTPGTITVEWLKTKGGQERRRGYRGREVRRGKPSTGMIVGGTAPALETGVERVGRAVEDGGQLMVCLLSREVAAQ